MESTPTVPGEKKLVRGGKYPLTIFGDPGGQIDLPGRPGPIDRERLLTRKDIVILGERSSGISDFFEWCGRELEGEPVISVTGSVWLSKLTKVAGDGLVSREEKDRKANIIVSGKCFQGRGS